MIHTVSHGDILEIQIANPPVNALAAGVRQGLTEAIAQGQSDPAITAIIIRGNGKLFSGGADIAEFDKPIEDPLPPVIFDAIEASAKPVIAAIHGMALGGGLELALACHYRVATKGAKLGLPEVKLGLLPGAGGTQRLPRLIGISAALDMIVSGSTMSATRAKELGLVDALADDAELLRDAIAFAQNVSEPRRSSALTVAAEPEALEQFVSANARRLKGQDAPQACIEAVKASAELPFEEGMLKERALFARLMNGDQSKSLHHIFFAERTAAKIDDMPKDVQPRAVGRVGVIGAGTMGGGIAMNFLSAGIPVTIVEMTQEALERGVGIIRKNYETSAARGRITSDQVEQVMGLLKPTLDFGSLAECDLIIEAVYESMGVKKEVFSKLDRIAKPGALLASNTSYLDIDEIASVTGRPQDVVGMHFFSPANVMKLVEVVRGASTAPDVLATAMELSRRIGKVSVVSGVCHGFIGNRMLLPQLTNAIELVLDGATPAQVDKVHADFGMPMGPFLMTDLAGVDIGWHRDPARIESLRDAMCAEGRLGQKVNAGFYDYDDKRRPSPSPVAAKIIAGFAHKQGRGARQISDEEIIVRTLYTMVNEGAKILDEGIAQRASDIDVVWVFGYGWPAVKGGPMHWANSVGLTDIVNSLDAYKDRLGTDFTLSPLLSACAAQGRALDR